MKKILASILIVSLLAGCGQTLTVKVPVKDGKPATTKTYPTYGLFNADTQKSSKVCYEPSVGNIVLAIIFVETIVAPVYFIGFDFMNPVKMKPDNGKCNIDGNDN